MMFVDIPKTVKGRNSVTESVMLAVQKVSVSVHRLLRFDTCFVEALSVTLTKPKDEKIFQCFRKYDRPQQ